MTYPDDNVCMCGSPMDTHGWDNHSPISVSDYYAMLQEEKQLAEQQLTDTQKKLLALVRHFGIVTTLDGEPSHQNALALKELGLIVEQESREGWTAWKPT